MVVACTVVTLTLIWASQPAVAQKQAVKRGQGAEVERGAKARGQAVRGERDGEATRGRTSGRADRSESSSERVIVTQDGRRESVRDVIIRRDDRDVRRGDRNDERYGDDNYGRRGSDQGPKFCRTGAGHPVFGMRWCHDKGFTRGYDARTRGLDDIILRRPDDRSRTVTRGGIEDILGDVVLGRLDALRFERNLNGALNGQWRDSNDGSTLRIYSGRTPLAEFMDRTRDGRADVVLIR